MPDFSTVPWTRGEVIDALFLLVCCVITGAAPLYYVAKANLRDPLARAVLMGMGATTVVFQVSLAATIAFHAGWQPTVPLLHWLTRITYSAVAFGELIFLFALVVTIRERQESS